MFLLFASSTKIGCLVMSIKQLISHRASLDDKKQRRKNRKASATTSNQTFSCGHCHWTCLSHIGLVSHECVCCNRCGSPPPPRGPTHISYWWGRGGGWGIVLIWNFGQKHLLLGLSKTRGVFGVLYFSSAQINNKKSIIYCWCGIFLGMLKT